MGCYVIAFGNPHCFLDFPHECGGKAAEGRVSLEKIASVFGMIKMRLNSLHGISGDVASLSSRLMSGVGADMDSGAYVDVNITMDGVEGMEDTLPLSEKSSVRICRSDTLSNEVGMAMRIASSALSGGKLCAILLPNHAMISEFANCLISINSIMEDMSVMWNGRYNLLNSSFRRFDIPVRCVSRKTPCLRSDSIVLMTIEDAMGLHFDTVILPWTSPYPVSEWGEYRCHKMLSAALTRCSGDVLMSYSGQMPKWLGVIRPYCTVENITPEVNPMPEVDSAPDVNANLQVNAEAQGLDSTLDVNATLEVKLAKPGYVA